VASLTAPSGYDWVWSSNLALTQVAASAGYFCSRTAFIKVRLRRGRGYPRCVPAVRDIQWQRPRSRRPEES
jgi:hypothetical protein